MSEMFMCPVPGCDWTWSPARPVHPSLVGIQRRHIHNVLEKHVKSHGLDIGFMAAGDDLPE